LGCWGKGMGEAVSLGEESLPSRPCLWTRQPCTLS
jgi:hypothetical protein